MAEKLMKVSCAPECGFSITTHDRKELFGYVKTHAKSKHKMDVPDSKITAMMTSA